MIRAMECFVAMILRSYSMPMHYRILGPRAKLLDLICRLFISVIFIAFVWVVFG